MASRRADRNWSLSSPRSVAQTQARPGASRTKAWLRSAERSEGRRWLAVWGGWGGGVELTAGGCDLSQRQAAQIHAGLEGVGAAVAQREGQVAQSPPGQHQNVVEEEEAQVRDLLVGAGGSHDR